MSKKREYVFYKCNDCEIDFLLAKKGSGRTSKFCPTCGENLYTEKIMDIWLERPFQYKRPWTPEEDALIATGKRLGYSNKRIAESLTGRTAKAINNRWYLLMKKEIV